MHFWICSDLLWTMNSCSAEAFTSDFQDQNSRRRDYSSLNDPSVCVCVCEAWNPYCDHAWNVAASDLNVYRLTLPAFCPAVIQPPNLIPNPEKPLLLPFREGHRSGIIHAGEQEFQPLLSATFKICKVLTSVKNCFTKSDDNIKSNRVAEGELLNRFPGAPLLWMCRRICIASPVTCHRDQWNRMWACQQDNADCSPFISIRQQDW